MDLDSALTDKPAEGATATDILRADHREVERLFAEFEDAGDEDHARRVAMQTLCTQLELHDALETTAFYPALKATDPEGIGRAERDHDQVRDLLAELRGRNECDAGCAGLVAQLKGLVAAHVRREEHELFPRLEQRSEHRLRELGLALIKRKEELARSTEEFEGPAT